MSYCKICGEYNCKKHPLSISKTKFITSFSGSSPPDIFVGRWNYPNVYAGILSPEEYGDTRLFSSHEMWHERKLPISEILSFRNKLIYGRAMTNVHKLNSKFLSTMGEIAMTHKSVAAEFKLRKPITKNKEQDSKVPRIARAGEVASVRLEENPAVKPKVDYLVNDTEVKSSIAMIELEKAGIPTSTIIKMLSAGLLGIKNQRKLVPTRWSITATDDTLSKEKLKKIRFFKEISEIMVFTAEYLGNHYEFLLLPEKFSFEVIEISTKNMRVWHDYETFFSRKKYAEDVTGAYYANRLALTEYLERIQRQCHCIVFREVRPEYYAPMGVGILRQISRDAFANQGKKFSTLCDAFEDIQSRLTIPISNFTSKSVLLKNYGKQRRITQWF